VRFLKIAGTKSGRIFMCADNGSLYEIEFPKESWWGKSKVRKLNRSSTLSFDLLSFLQFSAQEKLCDLVIDEPRKLLYTVSISLRFNVSL